MSTRKSLTFHGGHGIIPIMTKRISKIEHGLLLALASSLRSEDPHTKVGCALEDHQGRITVVGYNGLKEKQSLSFDAKTERDRKKFHFIHAETNALSLVKRGDIKTIYLTYSPCVACCQNLGANGIEKVVFLYEYTPEYKEVLDSYGIEYVHYTQIEHPVLKYMMELDELKRIPRENADAFTEEGPVVLDERCMEYIQIAPKE